MFKEDKAPVRAPLNFFENEGIEALGYKDMAARVNDRVVLIRMKVTSVKESSKEVKILVVGVEDYGVIERRREEEKGRSRILIYVRQSKQNILKARDSPIKRKHGDR
jgi:hypothetical protein